MLEALADTATGVEIEATRSYRGDAEWLVTGPLGDPTRLEAFKRHRAKGGRTLICDLGYWRRKIGPGDDRLMRFSIDGGHPQNMLFLGPSDPSRLAAQGVSARDGYDRDGPIVIIGLGPKGARWAGTRIGEFETRALEMCRRRWPGRQVVYRPKVRNGNASFTLAGADATKASGDISEALDGASLVINQHSNAGVDAVVHGIPILSEDGAACAIAGEGLGRDPRPIPLAERQRFLQHLAWWHWTVREAGEGMIWNWFNGVLDRERVEMVA